MNCTHPIYAVDLGLSNENAKKKILFLGGKVTYSQAEQKYGVGSIIPLPCGKCLACKVNYSREWSIRCMLEASLYQENYFLTLTYDDNHLPSGNLINKRHVQLFLKKLRKVIPGIRYFCCGEYGEHTLRPHYHLILFNCHIPDVKYIGKGKLGGYYCDSQLIKNIWSYGNITLGDVTVNSCEYVARYCMKKVTGEEFLLMSNRPGIGAGYFDKHYEAIYDTDGVYVNGRKYKVPRYFDRLLDRENMMLYFSVKFAREKDIRLRRYDNLLNHPGLIDEQIYKIQERSNELTYKDKLKGVL